MIKKLFVSHSPPKGKIIKGTFKSRWSKSIKDQKLIGGNIIANVYGNTKDEAEELAEYLVELYNKNIPEE